MKNVLRPRSFGMLVIALILAASIYGFAAANTVPGTSAGDGSGAISGYTVSNIVYGLNSDGDPSDYRFGLLHAERRGLGGIHLLRWRHKLGELHDLRRHERHLLRPV